MKTQLSSGDEKSGDDRVFKMKRRINVGRKITISDIQMNAQLDSRQGVPITEKQ